MDDSSYNIIRDADVLFVREKALPTSDELDVRGLAFGRNVGFEQLVRPIFRITV